MPLKGRRGSALVGVGFDMSRKSVLTFEIEAHRLVMRAVLGPVLAHPHEEEQMDAALQPLGDAPPD
jgi:hypothetical protein